MTHPRAIKNGRSIKHFLIYSKSLYFISSAFSLSSISSPPRALLLSMLTLPWGSQVIKQLNQSQPTLYLFHFHVTQEAVAWHCSLGRKILIDKQLATSLSSPRIFDSFFFHSFILNLSFFSLRNTFTHSRLPAGSIYNTVQAKRHALMKCISPRVFPPNGSAPMDSASSIGVSDAST